MIVFDSIHSTHRQYKLPAKQLLTTTEVAVGLFIFLSLEVDDGDRV